MRALQFLFTFSIIGLLSFNANAQSINSSQFNIDSVRSFSFIFGNSYAKDPQPLGVNFSMEAQGTYIHTTNVSDNFKSDQWLTTLSVKKGIYWNMHLDLSFLSPINDNFQNGFSAGAGHTLESKWGHLSSSLYVFSYNITESLNQRGLGLTTVFYFKTAGFYTGLGLGAEDATSELQSTSDNEGSDIKLFTYRGLISFLVPKGKSRFSLNGTYLNSDIHSLSFSYGLRL